MFEEASAACTMSAGRLIPSSPPAIASGVETASGAVTFPLSLDDPRLAVLLPPSPKASARHRGPSTPPGKSRGPGTPRAALPPLLAGLHTLLDWRVNASLCAHYLPILPVSHVMHAVRARARHAYTVSDRAALAGALATAHTRLHPLRYRRLRLSVLVDGVKRLSRLVSSLPPIRRVAPDTVLQPLGAEATPRVRTVVPYEC